MKRVVAWMAAAAAGLIAAGTAGAHSDQGFLYGTVETRAGQSYTGILRWGDEESFWDDHFNSVKADLPYQDKMPDRERRRRRSRLEVFGIDIDYKWDHDYVSRQFVARFGDIASIEPGAGEKAREETHADLRAPLLGAA